MTISARTKSISLSGVVISDKLDLFALDEIVGVCRVWTAAFLGTGELCWPLPTKKIVLEGAVHPAWRAKEGWRPKLTALDLRQAYKQFPISSACQALGVIALRNPKSSVVRFFVSKALAFGSSASVLHFNRLSRLYRRVGLEVGLFWANFFDDFPVMSPACSRLGKTYLGSLVQRISWPLSLPAPLCWEWRLTVPGEVLVRKKEGRTSEVVEVLRDLVKKRTVTHRELWAVSSTRTRR